MASELEKRLLNGHLYYSSICNPENLVYSSYSIDIPKPLPYRINEIKEKTDQTFNAGFSRAQGFFKGAQFYISSKHLSLAAFMLHQSAEQIMRAFILTITGSDFKSHSIIELRNEVQKWLLNFKFLDPLFSDWDHYLLDRLETAYICCRYTNCYSIDTETVNTLLKHVQQLLLDIQKAYDEMISTFTLPKP